MFDTIPEGTSRPLQQLAEELGELAAYLAAGTRRWLTLVEEFDRREGWAGVGMRSCAHWLSWRCGVALPAAREQVRVARALHRQPCVRAAFAMGRLSYSKVRAITGVADELDEERLLELPLASGAGRAAGKGLRRVAAPRAVIRGRSDTRLALSSARCGWPPDPCPPDGSAPGGADPGWRCSAEHHAAG
jgi:hypothetical protein